MRRGGRVRGLVRHPYAQSGGRGPGGHCRGHPHGSNRGRGPADFPYLSGGAADRRRRPSRGRSPRAGGPSAASRAGRGLRYAHAVVRHDQSERGAAARGAGGRSGRSGGAAARSRGAAASGGVPQYCGGAGPGRLAADPPVAVRDPVPSWPDRVWPILAEIWSWSPPTLSASCC